MTHTNTSTIACRASLLLLFAAPLFAGCATTDFDYPRESSYAIGADEDTRLRDMVDDWYSRSEGPSGFYVLHGGNDALGARLRLAEAADKSIDVQYFLMKGDDAGQVFAGALLDAADRDVRVRFLLDDIFTTVEDEELALLDAHPNIEVRLHNPIARRGIMTLNFLGDFERANRRMHNKSFTVDNQATIVGGRNIADEYFDLNSDVEFLDLDVLGMGPVAQDVSKVFDDFWNHARSLPIEAVVQPFSEDELELARQGIDEERRDAEASIRRRAIESGLLAELIEETRQMHSADAEVLTDDPSKLEQPRSEETIKLVRELVDAIDHATSEVVIFTPYLVPDRATIEFWRSIVDEGVRVVMVTNSLASNNHTAVHSAYAKYRKPMIEVGIELYEARVDAVSDSEPSDADHLTLHSKAMIIDRKRLFIGSLNLDPRSIEINSEMGLMIDSPAMSEELATLIFDDLDEFAYRVELDERGRLQWRVIVDGLEVVETSEPQAGTWLKFKAWFLKIVPDSQL